MSLNQPALATNEPTFGNMDADMALASYQRARDFATECWRRARRQRLQTGARREG